MTLTDALFYGVFNIYQQKVLTMDALARKQFYQYFTKGVRTDGASFYKCIEGAPDELRKLIRKIHTDYFCDCLPNDWIYETIYDAFMDLNTDELDKCTIEADPYNSQLYKWLGEPYADIYCSDVVTDGLCDLTDYKRFNIYHVISTAQWSAKQVIYSCVNDFIQGE